MSAAMSHSYGQAESSSQQWDPVATSTTLGSCDDIRTTKNKQQRTNNKDQRPKTRTRRIENGFVSLWIVRKKKVRSQ
jgi:hypothetical protein